MTRRLSLTLLVFACACAAVARRGASAFSDGWSGVVVAVNDGTREITLQRSYQGKTETFIGVLEEGYKVKTSDGSEHELKVSEIPLGTRLWITYETRRRDSGGQKVKINVITRLGVFPKDKYVQLRERLNLPASTPITDSEKRALPGGDPLKMYVAIEDSRVLAAGGGYGRGFFLRQRAG